MAEMLCVNFLSYVFFALNTVQGGPQNEQG